MKRQWLRTWLASALRQILAFRELILDARLRVSRFAANIGSGAGEARAPLPFERPASRKPLSIRGLAAIGLAIA
jgi:hypothetical protein